jgi:hypothetical protein
MRYWSRFRSCFPFELLRLVSTLFRLAGVERLLLLVESANSKLWGVRVVVYLYCKSS